MQDYIIMTDSSCDLPAQIADELELEVLPLSVAADGKEYLNYLDWRDISAHDFYELLRQKKTASTSAVNFQSFYNKIDELAQKGKDILYLGFSSALSGTYNAGATAIKEVSAKYPERKLFSVDTLCASLGQGLLVYLAAQKKKLGETIEQVRDFVEENKLHLCHWFTVDDLWHLKRGGRVSGASAALGTVLGIKPVMHVDDEGRLINVSKVRGRKNSIKAMFEHMKQSAISPKDQTVFISHGDCFDEANYLADMIRAEWGIKTIVLNYVGPVIGAHSGPGTLALFFLGTSR